MCLCAGVHICERAHAWMLEINVGYLVFFDHSLLHFLSSLIELGAY